MKNLRRFQISCSLLLLLAAVGCTTEDVKPTVSLASNVERFDYNNGQATVFAVLNGPVNQEIAVELTFNGDASLNQDFTVSNEVIVVPSGQDRGFIVLTGIPEADTAIKQISITIKANDAYIVGAESSITLELQDCTGDRDGDGVLDCDDLCPDEPGPPENGGCPWLGLFINEILYDPPTGIAGDSNGDGTRQPQEDEFIELYNSNPDLDISGYTISDLDGVRHVFPSGTIIPSKGAIVIFGGGNPTGGFGGALVQTASTGLLSLNRGGDIITLRDDQGQVLDVFDINNFNDRAAQSLTRVPDITGEAFQEHSTVAESGGRLFSPGVRLNGESF
ncbi:MAG: lamin tail domain-containing protein [Schleiferiaceae bacterium]|nr:lamin tail domain-containing protein [Schleiferiaceae bacterium]